MNHCPNCNSLITYNIISTPLCSGCGGCNLCCRHHMKLFNSKLKFHKPTKKQLKNNTSSRFIATEIEVARIRGNEKGLSKTVKGWNGSVVRDGSLPFGGFEINTAPAGGDVFVKQVVEICDELATCKAEVNPQCGLHVHLDARDFNFYDIRRLVKIYSAIEPTLFEMVPASRRLSHYCVRCGDMYTAAIQSGKLPHSKLKEAVVYGVYGDRESTVHRKHKYPDDLRRARYNALNLHSWFYRGTVECRLLEGTVDPNEIVSWGVLWANILDFALHSSDDEVAGFDKKHSYDHLIEIIDKTTFNGMIQDFIKQRHKLYSKGKK